MRLNRPPMTKNTGVVTNAATTPVFYSFVLKRSLAGTQGIYFIPHWEMA